MKQHQEECLDSPYGKPPGIQTTEEEERMEPEKPAESVLAPHWRLGLEHHCPPASRPPRMRLAEP